MRPYVSAVCAVLLIMTINGSPSSARSVAPAYSQAFKLPDADGNTEPRIAIDSEGRRFVIANLGRTAVVYRSDDNGQTWALTTTNFPLQTQPTIDVDIVALPTGRLVATELDFAGINFPTAYSDDRGQSWTASTGPELVDMDRQWLAVGPKDPTTNMYRVYLLYHNLASGFASHNMWVMTSLDGGAHFLPPNPINLPGQQSYLDLQCADSGGPSSLMVNQKTGRLYAVWGTRSSATGGCAAQPPEVNIVSATRVWVATSPDNSPGSWTQSIAVDDSQTGNIVGMQLSPGTLDDQGNVWVVYPESLRPYPDFSGASIRVVHAPADLSSWSRPITVVKGGGSGNLLPHILAGDPGKIAVAYFHGVASRRYEPSWFMHVATTYNGLSTHPKIYDLTLSSIPTYTWTASEMMGACNPPSAVSGVENGFGCNRSTDVWGTALDARCYPMWSWPTSKQVDGATPQPGTWVSMQTGGQPLCTPRSQ
ncbi:MAG: exo-alpha-sialidase [Actinomycetota bacterium]